MNYFEFETERVEKLGNLSGIDQYMLHQHFKNHLCKLLLTLGVVCMISITAYTQGDKEVPALKVIFIRHAEKSAKGDNLSCQGFNRSIQLPALISSRYGIPDFTYVPAIGLGDATKHSRMFQTVIPLGVKFNLVINSKFEEKDSVGIATDIMKKKGIVLVVWEHKAISSLVHAIGIRNDGLQWADDDYDSIWIINISGGIATMKLEKENLKLSSTCPF